MNVLIVEDEKVTQHILKKYLTDWGHEVSLANDGRQAWEMYQSREFPIVISDWNMPEMSGLELVQRIRNGDQDHYGYIILLTSRSETYDLVTGLDQGADDFLRKPFDQNELRARLRAGERIVTLQKTLQQRNLALQQANEQLARDLAAAARAQQALLPTQMPQSPAANFAWSFKPCQQLAGDNLNVFYLDDDHIAVYVADVSCHGVAASMLSVTISQLLSPSTSQSGLLVQSVGGGSELMIKSPLQVVEELNRRFPKEEFEDNYFTIVYGILNTDNCEFRFVSAGHPPIILMAKDAMPRLIQANGPPIGWQSSGAYEEQVIQLKSGDRLCIYSDGVSAAANGQNERYGNARLMESLTSNVQLPIDDCVSEAMLKIESWCGPGGLSDDLSMLAIEINA